MKKPWPVALVQVIPAVALEHANEPTWETSPTRSGGAWGSRAVSPAQTNWPRPVIPTYSPWPKSTSEGHDFGCDGGDQLRFLMSQRASPSMMSQPMLADGLRKVVSWTVLAGAVVVDAEVDVEVVPVRVVRPAVAELELVGVDTDPVLVALDPHPASAATITRQAARTMVDSLSRLTQHRRRPVGNG